MQARSKFIFVETKTKTGNFGSVLYIIEQEGLPCTVCGQTDGVKCVMVGGTGPSAVRGRVVYDCQKEIEKNMQSGVTKPVENEEELGEIVSSFPL